MPYLARDGTDLIQGKGSRPEREPLIAPGLEQIEMPKEQERLNRQRPQQRVSRPSEPPLHPTHRRRYYIGGSGFSTRLGYTGSSILFEL